MKPILFLHIPKTAGSSFNNFLSEISKENVINYARGSAAGYVDNFSLEYFKNKKNIEIYSGHFVFSEECKKFQIFTLLRSLEGYFFSNLYYQYFYNYRVKSLNQKNLDHIIKKNNFKLTLKINDYLEIIKLLHNNNIVSNCFTKTLAGIRYEKFFYCKYDNKIDEEDYQKALSNIKYFKLIGMSENFDIFIKNFLSIYKFKIESYTNLNISNYDKDFILEIKKKTSKNIIKYNNFDFRLINEIKNLK